MYHFRGATNTYWVHPKMLTSWHPWELEQTNNIVWIITPDSGDFYWPHFKEKDGSLTELENRDTSYND